MCGRDPIWQNRKDQFTLTCIRRVSLDAFWAREPRTVASNWARSKADYDMVVDNLSVPPEALLPQLGNPRLEDRVGIGNGPGSHDRLHLVAAWKELHPHPTSVRLERG